MARNNPRPKLKVSAMKRVTADTKFHIDYQWWDESDIDMKTYLFKSLSIKEDFELDISIDKIDLVDTKTGEVRVVDRFQYMVQNHLRQLPDDFVARTAMVDAVFCVLLANGNHPLTAREIAQRIRRSPDVILRTLGGSRVYQGIRPLLDDV